MIVFVPWSAESVSESSASWGFRRFTNGKLCEANDVHVSIFGKQFRSLRKHRPVHSRFKDAIKRMYCPAPPRRLPSMLGRVAG